MDLLRVSYNILHRKLVYFYLGDFKDLPGAITDNTITGTGTIADPFSVVKPYKVYRALITQSGSSAPTAVVLENTIGTIVWSRTSAGAYLGTLTGAFLASKVHCLLSPAGVTTATPESYALGRATDNAVALASVSNAAAADDLLNNLAIEIKVYP